MGTKNRTALRIAVEISMEVADAVDPRHPHGAISSYHAPMASLVLELQQEAASGSTALPDVLRKARMVATKLKLAEMNAWIEHELHGYPPEADVPEYRQLHGDVRAHNPYNGALMPIRFTDPSLQDMLSSCTIRQSIGSLHEVTGSASGFLQMPFSEQQMVSLRQMLGPDDSEWMIPFRKFDKSQVTAIFDAVRNRILDWTLRLEAEGIMGEGMTFTPQERDRAASMTSISIGSVENFQGVIGTVSGSTLHVDNVAAVDAALKTQGFTSEQRTEIQELIAQHKAARPDGNLSAAKRGIQWVVDHAEKLGVLASMFRDFFGK